MGDNFQHQCQCPQCKIMVSIRKTVCECGFNLRDKPMKDFNVAVPPKRTCSMKQCPSCNIALPPRKICECGYNFKKKACVQQFSTYKEKHRLQSRHSMQLLRSSESSEAA